MRYPSLFLALLFTATGCDQRVAETTGATPPDSHQRMLDELDFIRRRTADHHPFLGTRAFREAEKAIANANPATSDLCRLHGVLAEELLRAGRTDEAIENLQKSRERLPVDSSENSKNIRRHVLYRLAIAHLRRGETSNCIHCVNGESCLLPIHDAGIHKDPAGSRAAVQLLRELLTLEPDHQEAIWLLNVAAMTLGEYPEGVPDAFRIPPETFPENHPTIRPFRNVSSEWKLATVNPAGSVVLDDFNGDNRIDIVTSTWDTAGALRYFERTTDGSWSDKTDSAGLDGIFGGLNLIQADYDNDGDTDILVLRGAWLEAEGRHPNSLLQNDGRGRFRDVTWEVGLADRNFPTQTASWADYDNDGDLDLYIGNEGYPCQLFQNDSGKYFRDVAAAAGVENNRHAKGVIWGDFDNDRLPDLYVSNLPQKNRLYHNNGHGKFADVAESLQVDRPINSFPCWFFDYDNDGILDLYVASFTPGIRFVAADYLGKSVTCEPDALYRGLSGGRFRDVASEAGLNQVTQPMGSNFGDLDNDGFLDFYLGTGYVDYEGLMPNLLFRNNRGQTFENVTWSARMGHLQKGHGIAFADLDADGDEDVFAQMGGWFAGDAFANAVFENPGTSGSWVGVRLIGNRSNRSAIGARIKVTISESGQPRSIFRWVNSGGTFGGNPLRQHIGLGAADSIDRIEIDWPTTEEHQVFESVEAGRWYEVTEGTPALRPISFAADP